MRQIQGLSEHEVEERRRRGEGNNVEQKTSRTYGEIIRKNLFNFVHLILFIIGAVFILLGRYGDAFNSAGLILLNVLIGVVQEIRAKRKLDEIALLTRPKVQVLRAGQEKEVDPAELVRGDILVVRPGDQFVVDGTVVDGVMEVDESLLTGESDAIRKEAGSEVLSGSFCITGRALYEAEKVGAESFANQLTATAREFRVETTPLQRDIDYILRIMLLVALFFGFLLFLSSVIYEIPFLRNVQLAAVIMGFVPVGLFFMTIVSYALGAVRLLGSGALIQETNAVESLSNVNVLCTDKTGTLTSNSIEFHDVVPYGVDKAALQEILGDFGRSASVTNRTGEAIAEALPGRERSRADEVVFSSARKWSALAFDDDERRGVYVLGALEMLQPHMMAADGLAEQVSEFSQQGLRVLTFAHSAETTCLHDDAGEPILPRLQPLGILTFRDALRPGVHETIEGFTQAGVRLKIISGDNPATVAALVRQAGLVDDLMLVSGPELAEMSEAEFAQAADEATVFGRITPEQKEHLVDALRSRGNYVAMIGDGVNDVLSLKKANLGIAMGSGTAATRGVADIVLLNDSFQAMVPALQEGQRIITGMQDIARLYLARTFSVVLLLLTAAVIGIAPPFLPSNSGLYALLVVGLPTMALAYWAQPRPPVPNRFKDMIQFALPVAGLNMMFGIVLCALAYFVVLNGIATYEIPQAQLDAFQDFIGFSFRSMDEARSEAAGIVARNVLTTFLVLNGLLLILLIKPPVRFLAIINPLAKDRKMLLVALAMVVMFIAILLIEPLRRFYELIVLRPQDYLLIVGLSFIWFALLYVAFRTRLFERMLRASR